MTCLTPFWLGTLDSLQSFVNRDYYYKNAYLPGKFYKD